MKPPLLAVLLIGALTGIHASAADAEPPPPGAAATQVNGDARCLVVAMVMSRSPEPKTQQAALLASYYYFGRLDGLSTRIDLEALLATAAGQMTLEQVWAEAPRCSAELAARGRYLAAIGQHLTGPTTPSGPSEAPATLKPPPGP